MKNDGHTNTANFNAQIAIEALAYSTTQPELKQDLADEPPVLARIMQIVIADPTNRPLIYGALIIMANLTDYTPELTAEQQRMAQLKAYANQSKPVESSPKDKPEKVTERCAVLGESGLITMLVKTAKEASPTSLALISKISLNLAKERKHAGPMLQEGIFDILLPIAAYKGEDTSLNHAMAAAARTLARLLIPFDPRLIFAGSGPNGRRDTAVPLVVRLLRSLLDDPTIEVISRTKGRSMVLTVIQDPRVPFEALQALTNLASMDEQVATLITEQAFISVESYLTSNLSAQQQAAIECMANLTTCQACSNMFIASGECRFPPDYEGESELDHREETRFCRLVALTEDEARGIRLSAMAALYNVCESLPGARMLSDYHSGFEQVVPQLEATVGQRGDSPDGEMRARAAGVVYNVLRHGDEAVTKMLMERNVEQKLEASKKKDPTGKV